MQILQEEADEYVYWVCSKKISYMIKRGVRFRAKQMS